MWHNHIFGLHNHLSDNALPGFVMPFSHDDHPREARDIPDSVKDRHFSALRYKQDRLEAENRRLREMLKIHGIPLSLNPDTNMDINDETPCLPQLPMEVLLLIMKYALTSSRPILDPLCRRDPKSMTKEERECGNMVAIGILATSKAFHEEGSKIFWSGNTFGFTRPEALRSFGEADLKIRMSINHINMRITARYYDDKEREKPHMITRDYHPSLQRRFPIDVQKRSSMNEPERGGFRSYSWYQISDFLFCLRGPWSPRLYSKLPSTRIFPNLKSLRIDLVNFLTNIQQYAVIDFHELTAHEFSHILEELHITGMPTDGSGFKAAAELTGMLKDGGLLLTSAASYYYSRDEGMCLLNGNAILSRLVRSYKLKPEKIKKIEKDIHKMPTDAKAKRNAAMATDEAKLKRILMCPKPVYEYRPREASSIDKIWNCRTHEELEALALEMHQQSLQTQRLESYPMNPTTRRFDNQNFMWKLVPTGRDSNQRQWMPFDLKTGHMESLQCEDMAELLRECFVKGTRCDYSRADDIDAIVAELMLLEKMGKLSTPEEEMEVQYTIMYQEMDDSRPPSLNSSDF